MKPQGTQLSLFETRSSSDPFAVRVSARARRLTARVHVGGRVEIVVPVGVNARAVRDFVQRFTPWIDRKVAAMQCFAEPSRAGAAERRIRLHRRALRGEVAGSGEALDRAGRRPAHRARPGRRRCAAAAAGTGSSARPKSGLAPRLLELAARIELFGASGGDPLPAHALGQLLDARHGEPELLAWFFFDPKWCATCSCTSSRTPAHESFARAFGAWSRSSSRTTGGSTGSCSRAGAPFPCGCSR